MLRAQDSRKGKAEWTVERVNCVAGVLKSSGQQEGQSSRQGNPPYVTYWGVTAVQINVE